MYLGEEFATELLTARQVRDISTSKLRMQKQTSDGKAVVTGCFGERRV